MIGCRPTPIDRALLRIWSRSRRLDIDALGLLDTSKRDPNIGYIRFGLLVVLWIFTYCGCSLVWLGILAILRSADVVPHKSGVIVFVFIAAFCITGIADALWRAWLLWYARKGYQPWTGETDATASKLMRLAEINDGTLVLQLVVALVVAAWAS
jgi:hypothetical protein